MNSEFPLSAESRNIRVGSVSVGSEMRRRHPPSFFRGQAAMPETEEEVWEIYRGQLDAALDAKCDVVFVDGQPRMISQVSAVVSDMDDRFPRDGGPPRRSLWEYPALFMHLVAPDKELIRRMEIRDGDDPEKLKLSRSRMSRDKEQLYDVLADISLRMPGEALISVPTASRAYLRHALSNVVGRLRQILQ